MEKYDYVRFKDKKGNQYIRRIMEICSETGHERYGAIRIDKKANNVYCVSAKNIIETKPEKIDLIRPGDYVNGYKVVQTDKSIEGRKYVTTEAYHKINYGNVFGYEITSIVTKEQFERMAYETGEDHGDR